MTVLFFYRIDLIVYLFNGQSRINSNNLIKFLIDYIFLS